jgi:hypothetical protein
MMSDGRVTNRQEFDAVLHARNTIRQLLSDWLRAQGLDITARDIAR